jgi:uncharacterized protein (DUF362 family)
MGSVMRQSCQRRKFLRQIISGTAAIAGCGPLQRAGRPVHTTSATPWPEGWAMPSIDGLPTIDVDDEEAKRRIDAPVAVCKSSIPAEAGYEILRLLQPTLQSDRVFIKVNCSFHTSRNWKKFTKQDRHRMWGACSDPRFVEGVIQYFQEQGIGPRNITIGEAVGGRMEIDDYFELLGFTALSKKSGVRLINLNRSKAVGVRIARSSNLSSLAVAKPVVDHFRDGVLVNLAKMKNHRLPGVSLCAKNMMGVILPPNAKRLMHAEFGNSAIPDQENQYENWRYYEALVLFGARLADLNQLTPDINMVDGVIASEGSGFLEPDTDETVPVDSRRAFAGINLFNVDAVASHFMGYDPREPNLELFPEMEKFWWIFFGAMRGYGHMDIEKIPIIGNPVLIRSEKRFRLYSPYQLV